MEDIPISITLEEPNHSWEEFYLGSRKFIFLTKATGLPIDQVNFLLGQFMALFIAFLFRVALHPSKASATTRHCTALSAGILISYFCFGKQVLLAIGLAALCYAILSFLPLSISHHVTLVVSMAFLSAVHILRQYYEDGVFVIDITGPLMILVQKVTALAYSLHDGMQKERKDLRPLQESLALRKLPTLLEYFSYVLTFQSILAGPFFMFVDYQDFIEGTHYVKMEAMNKSNQEKLVGVEFQLDSNGNKNLLTNENEESPIHKKKFMEPNPAKAASKKLLFAIMLCISVITLVPRFPVSYLAEQSFLESSFLYKSLYILWSTSLCRHLYFTGWMLADAVCNLSGFGFSGYDKNGQSSWDYISNVDIIGFEFGASFKTTLQSWNIGTVRWLRFLVYERAAYGQIALTYLLSCCWHGFYPGYYLTFLAAAFYTMAGRTARRSIKHRVCVGRWSQICYDVVTCATTRVCLSYGVFPFVMLRFWSSINVYMSLYFYMHILCIVAHLGLPLILPPEQKKTTKAE